MKRFYNILTSTLIGIGTVAGLSAEAASTRWLRSPELQAETTVARQQKNPKQLFLRRMGATDPYARIQSEGSHTVNIMPQETRQRPDYIRRSISQPRGNVYAMVPRHSSMVIADHAFLGKIDAASGRMTNLYTGQVFCPSLGDDYMLSSMAERKGVLYIPSSGLATTGGDGIRWNRVDIATGTVLDPIVLGNQEYNAYAMTYDPDGDMFYILSFDSMTDDHIYVSSVDPNKNYQLTPLFDFSSTTYPSALAYYPPTKQVYVFRADLTVWAFNTTGSKRFIEVGKLDAFNISPFSGVYNSAHLTYSPLDEAFVGVTADNMAQSNTLLYIDPEEFITYEGQRVRMTPEGYIGAIVCTDAYAANEAPAQPEAPVFAFDKNNISGKITITAPKYNYAGVEIAAASKLDTRFTANGKTLFEGQLAPGESKTIDAALENGLFDFELQFTLGKNASPITRATFFVGNDNPVIPGELKLDGHKLSWQAAAEKGSHNGYVEAAAVRYNVYVGSEKQNSEPLTATEFQLKVPADMDLATIKVIATANGMDSEPLTVTGIIGEARELPATYAPTEQEARIFTVHDANNDGLKLQYNKKTQSYVFTFGQADIEGVKADDYIFLPAIKFPGTDNLYNFAFDYRLPYDGRVMPWKKSTESFSVVVATAPDAKSVINTVWSLENEVMTADKDNNLYTNANVSFAVPQAGTYYIGIHHTSVRAEGGRAMEFANFNLQQLNSSSAVPGEPEDITVEPAPKGALSATITAGLPSLDLTGKPLPAGSKVTLDAKCGDKTASITGVVGEKKSFSIEIPQSGFNTITITPSNDEGKGLSRNHALYIGLDTPLAVSNLRGVPSDDNKKLALTWDAPSEKGLNGGYVDPAGVQYDIYQVSGGVTSPEQQKLMATVNKNSATIELDPETYKKLNTVSFAVVAKNEIGSVNNNVPSVKEVLGKPYELPMLEEWGTQNFSFTPVYWLTGGVNNGSYFENVGNLVGYNFGGTFSFQKGGGVLGYNEGMKTTIGELVLPKASTAGVTAAAITIRMLDYAKAPEKLELVGRRAGHTDTEVIGTFEFQHPLAGEWVDHTFNLPESYCNAQWIQLRLRMPLTTDVDQYFVMDDYHIHAVIDYDFKASTITGPQQASVSETPVFQVSVYNSGLETQGGSMKFEVIGADKKVYLTRDFEVSRIVPGEVWQANVPVDIVADMADTDITLRATAKGQKDELDNNDTCEIKVHIVPTQAPVVGDLKAELNDAREVTLTWSEPAASEYGNRQDFEVDAPFQITENIGDWINLDLDKYETVQIANLNFPHTGEPRAWMVMDAEYLSLMNDERLAPHSGKQYIMAMAPGSDGELQASDWLISPEVVPGTEISFWYGTIDSQYKEYVELYYSSTDREVKSFTKLRSFSKDGAGTWEKCSYKLPKDAKYFAIVYKSFNSFGAMIDDIEFTPAKLNTWVIDSFKVWRAQGISKAEVIAEGLKSTTYVDKTPGHDEATYYVTTTVEYLNGLADGPASNRVSIASSAVDDITALEGVYGVKGAVVADGHAGKQMAIYATDGKFVKLAEIASDHATVACQPGIYIVKVGNAFAKVLVK